MDTSAFHRNGSATAAAEKTATLVINLCASMTSLNPHPQVLARAKAYRVYQLVRTEDGRPRHRLRIGFFSDPRDAEALLADLRQHYPTAFVARACEDDLHYARTQDFRDSPTMRLRALSVPPTTATVERPAPVPQAAPASPPARVLAPKPGNAPSRTPVMKVPARASAPAAARSEDTITYAIQLIRSRTPIRVSNLPQLDIFSAFSLYSVALRRDATVTYALRLGFFREQVSAEQVARYLKDYFPTRELVRVTPQEQSRYGGVRTFTSVPVVGTEVAAPASNVVRLNGARERPRLEAQPAGPAPVATPKPPPPTSTATPKMKAAPNAASPARGKEEKTLNQLLLEEAREVLLSQSGIRRQPANRASLLARLVGRLTGAESN